MIIRPRPQADNSPFRSATPSDRCTYHGRLSYRPDLADLLIQAATLHGENSERDHEVGDLQDLFFACWHVMTPEQRALALSDPAVKIVLSLPEYNGLVY